MTLPTLRRGGSVIPLRRAENQSNLINRIDPWNDIALMDRVFENLFRSPLSLIDSSSNGRNAGQEPNIELYETPDELVAFLFIAGIDPTSLDISATSEQLSIRGERKERLDVKDGTISHTPWLGAATTKSSFSASYTLPSEINPEKVTAGYKDGVIEVHMAKSEATKPKQVKVHIQADQP